MENNEIMTFEDVEIVDEIAVGNKPSISTGAAVAIGAGLALAVTAGVKLVKKAIAKHRAKKEQEQALCEEIVEVEDDEA